MSYNQSEYIQHLEAEVRLFKVYSHADIGIFSPIFQPLYFFISPPAWLQDELQGLKQRINVVVVENEKLQVELRSKAADESLKDYTLKNSMVMIIGVCSV